MAYRGGQLLNKRVTGLLFFGHLVNDFHQGALPALLPFFIIQHSLSYSAAAGVIFTFTGVSTVAQPLFGILADTRVRAWMIPTGIMITSFGFVLTSFSGSYVFLIMAVLLSGLGSAMFHPEAARTVNKGGGNNRATAMSFFGVGGTVGFSIGPAVMTSVLLVFGTKGMLLTIIPAAVIALLLSLQLQQANGEKIVTKMYSFDKRESPSDNWKGFVLLTTTIVGKSIIFYSLFTFIPLYWRDVLGQSEVSGGIALTLFSISGVIGNLIGGRLADKYGNIKIILLGCAMLVPTLPLLIWVNTTALGLPLLVLSGCFLLMTYGPTIVAGQRYLPNHVGFSSGMTLGVAFSIGGIVVPYIGHLADLYGISTAMLPIVAVPIVITIFASLLPEVGQNNSENEKG